MCFQDNQEQPRLRHYALTSSMKHFTENSPCCIAYTGLNRLVNQILYCFNTETIIGGAANGPVLGAPCSRIEECFNEGASAKPNLTMIVNWRPNPNSMPQCPALTPKDVYRWSGQLGNGWTGGYSRQNI